MNKYRIKLLTSDDKVVNAVYIERNRRLAVQRAHDDYGDINVVSVMEEKGPSDTDIAEELAGKNVSDDVKSYVMAMYYLINNISSGGKTRLRNKKEKGA